MDVDNTKDRFTDPVCRVVVVETVPMYRHILGGVGVVTLVMIIGWAFSVEIWFRPRPHLTAAGRCKEPSTAQSPQSLGAFIRCHNHNRCSALLTSC